jgi:nucleotide-binding universal stress UspA family protein
MEFLTRFANGKSQSNAPRITPPMTSNNTSPATCAGLRRPVVQRMKFTRRIREADMYKNILLAVDLDDELSCRKPVLSAIELARTFGARLHVLTVVREIEAILQAKTAPLGYDVVVADLENGLAAMIRRVNASDLNPNILVVHGPSIYAEILDVAEEAGADLIVIGSHRPAMKDYLLGTNAARVVRHARCSVLVARD